MRIRRELRRVLVTGTMVMSLGVLLLMGYCVALDMQSVHLAVLAVLTTSGPLISRIFEGLVRRRQIVLGLDRGGIEAEDEIMIARAVPLAMPVIGTLFAYFVAF